MKNISIVKGTKEIIKSHVLNNKKEYIIMTLIFIIGIFMGVLFINNINDDGKIEITNYINNFIEKLKEEENIDYIKILKTSVMQNITLAITIWFFGTTVIGLPVVFGLTLYRGFCLGYTISAITMSLGTMKGSIFICTSIFLQNIIFIPALIALGVSGFKLYKSIVKDRRKENIKPEILRHTIFSTLMLIVLMISSLIETFLSNNILQNIVKYLLLFRLKVNE